VRDVAFTDRPELESFHGRDRSRIAIESQKLNFVSLAILMNMDDRTYITGFKAFTWYWHS